MEKHEVVFLQAALDDLDEITIYIARDSKQAALRFRDKLIARAHSLASLPMLGVAVPVEKIGRHGFRMLMEGKYLIFYKVYGKRVVILRVLHGMRDYPRLLAYGTEGLDS